MGPRFPVGPSIPHHTHPSPWWPMVFWGGTTFYMKISKHTEKWEAEGRPNTQAIAFSILRRIQAQKGCLSCLKPHS